MFPAVEGKNWWVNIPAWAAGTWEFGNEVEHTGVEADRGLLSRLTRPGFRRGQPAGEAWSSSGKLDFSSLETFGSRGVNGFFGCQRDRQGKVWERGFIIHRTDYGEYGYHAQDTWEVLSASPNKIVVRNRILVIETDDDDRVSSVGRAEHLYTYVPYGDGERLLTVSTRTYTPGGKPLSTRRVSRLERLVSEFHPINTYDGDDLAQLFQAFLRERGLADLEPVARKG